MNISKHFYFLAFTFALLTFNSCNIEPFEGETSEEPNSQLPSTCEEAAQNTVDAALAYGNISPTDSDFANVCSAYKKALEDQVSVCGDQGGAFQTLIDSLGDCDKEDDNTNNEDGDYWPMKIGNSWTYLAQITGMVDSESTMEITDLVDYNGQESYLYENFFGSVQATDGTGFENLKVDYYTRKSNGEYELLVGELTAELAGLYKITQSEYSYVILKDNVDVGTKWDYNFDVVTSYEPLQSGGATLPDIPANYDIKLEILEKNSSIESGGMTFNSVIKVKVTQKVVVTGLTSTTDIIYYFAKDVGIVKSEGTVFDPDDNITSTSINEIKSYTIN